MLKTKVISKFPDFTNLDIAHKQAVDGIVGRFEPYSDFNFISLFSWDTTGDTAISEINTNLVIRLPDYLSAKPIYSFLGDTLVDESLKAVLAKVGNLQLVPEAVIQKINNPKDFIITEDEDNHDYIYSVDEHALLQGPKFGGKRKKAARFESKYKSRTLIKEMDMSSDEAVRAVRQIFEAWGKASKKNESDIAQERQAIERLLHHAPHFETIALVLTVDDQPAGFSVHELIGKEYAVCHFHKTIPHYANIDVYLTSAAAKDLKNRRQAYINWEQDLGLPGLKKSKQSYQPVKMLKKYTVKLAG